MQNTSGFNGTRQIIDIPGSGAAPLAIVATGPLRYVKVVESQLTAAGAVNAAEGFDYEIPNDGSAAGFVQAHRVAPYTVMELGDPMALASQHGSPLGNGPDQLGAGAGTRPATVLFLARSAAVAGTSIEVTQYY